MPIHFPDIPQRVRAYVYRIIAATLPLLVVFGVIDVDVDAVLGFVAAVLAVANTPTNG
jgi:ABC-type xylose transport system permease subunit